jgi:hypothetical protein
VSDSAFGNCTYHFDSASRQLMSISSGGLHKHAQEKWGLKWITICDYEIVATLGTPMSGKCM